MRIRQRIALFLLVLASVGSFNCKDGTGVRGVSLEVSFSEAALSDNLITDVQYKWKTQKNLIKLGEDCRVFVHFWHRSNLIFYDNHLPEIPPSKWEPEKEYSYQRRIYIPPFIESQDPEFKGYEILRLSAGLAFPAGSKEKPLRKIFEKELKVFPSFLSAPKIVYEEGWYDYEINPEAVFKRWRWTTKEARCFIDNPRRDALLVVKGGVNKEVLNDQKIILKIGDYILDEFVPDNIQFEKSYRIKKEMLGEKDRFYLVLSTDKTFIPEEVIPGSKDRRRLGVQISFLYFR